MIDLEKREFLYNQLKEIEKLANCEDLIEKEKFLLFSDVDLIKYVFSYRDKHHIYVNKKKVIPYIELPDINLEGESLSGIEISRFVPGIIQSDGKIVKSAINLKGTNAIINMSTIYHNEEVIHEDFNEYITDLSMSDFRGCNLYGRTQEEQKRNSSNPREKYVFLGKEQLDKIYIGRRQLHKLSQDKRRKSDDIYTQLLTGYPLSGRVGKDDKIDLTDYDFSGLPPYRVEQILKQIGKLKINIGYTGLMPLKLGAETLYTLSESIGDALKIGDTNFVGYYLRSMSNIDTSSNNGKKRQARLQMDIAYKKSMNYMFEKNPEKFPEKYWQYLEPRNLDRVSDLIYQAYKRRNYAKVLRNTRYANSRIISQIIEDSVEKEDETTFLTNFLSRLDVLSKDTLLFIYDKKGIDIIPGEMLSQDFFSEVIKKEYKRKNMQAVGRFMPRAKKTTAEAIIVKEYEKGNTSLAKENFSKSPSNIKSEVIISQYKSGKIEYVKTNLEHMTDTETIKFLLEVYKININDVKTFLGQMGFKRRVHLINEIVIKNEIQFAVKIWDSLTRDEQNRLIELQKKRGNLRFVFDIEHYVSQLRKEKQGRDSKEMILVEEDKKKGDLLRVYENENEFSFLDSKILPIEQRELLLQMLGQDVSKTKTQGKAGKTGREENERRRIVKEMIKRLQDKRLIVPAKIKTMYSEGGTLSATRRNDKEDLQRRGARVKYLVIDINGIIVLEPFGQKNNATFITVKDEDVGKRIVSFGRKGALDNDFYKVVHNENPNSGYNYESDHILKILDMILEDKESFLNILKGIKKGGNQYCNLGTLQAKYSAVALAREYELDKKDILSVGQENKTERRVEEPDEK